MFSVTLGQYKENDAAIWTNRALVDICCGSQLYFYQDWSPGLQYPQNDTPIS
jgi:hypothetical protein